MDSSALGPRRSITMPGVSCTVAEQIAAMAKVAGPECVKLIRRVQDPVVAKIVSGWPRNFDPQRALALGFKADKDFEDIIRIHIEDELQGTIK
jgi:D-erythronate 2-dehydrogenase